MKTLNTNTKTVQVLKDEILEKVFRKTENRKKIDFILKNTDVLINTIHKLSKINFLNPYHNFGHALGVAEYCIKLAIFANLRRNEINMLCIAALAHDSGHLGVKVDNEEKKSIKLALEKLDDVDIECTGLSFYYFKEIFKDEIKATKFSNRKKVNNVYLNIIQDADLAHIGQGVYYWAWASMGLIEEFRKEPGHSKMSPVYFIKVLQNNFIEYLNETEPGIWVSDPAKKLFKNPLDDVTKFKNWSNLAIKWAYDNRKKDITLAEFETLIQKFNLVSQRGH